MAASWDAYHGRSNRYDSFGGEQIRYSEEGDGINVKVYGDVGCARYVAIFIPGMSTDYAIRNNGAEVDNVVTVGSPGFGSHVGCEEALGGA